MLKLSEFDYLLPKELIAQYPLEHRQEARLLILERKSQKISHGIFKDIGGFLRKNDLVVLNDTKVLHCRLMGNKITGGRVEILLTRRLNGTTFSCLVQPVIAQGLTLPFQIIVILLSVLFGVPILFKIAHIIKVQVNKIRSANLFGSNVEPEYVDDEEEDDG